MHTQWLGLIVAFAATGSALAQSPAPPTTPSQATAISSAEILAEVQRNNAGALADSVLRVLPIESEYNIGVSVVRRSQVDGKTPPDAIVHDAITEVYQIVEGKGSWSPAAHWSRRRPFPPTVRSCVRSSGRVPLARSYRAGHDMRSGQETSSSSRHIRLTASWRSARRTSSTRSYESIRNRF